MDILHPGASNRRRGKHMRNEIKRRVVVTGLGAIAPNGIGKEAFWNATCRGISGIQPI